VHLPHRARATSRAEGAESAKRPGQTLDIGSVRQRARLQPHAAVCWGADQRKELEHLCRYITRPAIANERLKRNRAGDVVLQLKSAYKDGTTHLVMAPLQFMQRLAALVPRPRLHLIRFHGVLAPNAKLRSAITPSPPEPATEASTVDAQAQGAPARMSWARLLKRVFDIDIEHCPNCGGSLKIIAAIEDPPVILLGPEKKVV
jgi:Putative transposase